MTQFGEAFPKWEDKTEAIREAIQWASGVCGDWAYKKEAFSLPEDNTAWFELRMGRLRGLGVDELRNEDNIDPLTGEIDVEDPRAEVACGQRQFRVEVRFFNRDQEQDVVAWHVADTARARLRMSYPRERWLRPNVVSIVEMLDVFPMPSPIKVVQDRIQSEALLEMDFATVIAQRDASAVGTWIEAVEFAGTYECALDPGPFVGFVDASSLVTFEDVNVTFGDVQVTFPPEEP